MFRLFLAASIALASLAAPGSSGKSPYASALSRPTAESASAPPACARTACQADECISVNKATHCGPGPGGYGCRTTHC